MTLSEMKAIYPDDYHYKAAREGWFLAISWDGLPPHIQRLDDPAFWEDVVGMADMTGPVFESDEEAARFVAEQATKGSPHAIAAIKLIAYGLRPTSPE